MEVLELKKFPEPLFPGLYLRSQGSESHPPRRLCVTNASKFLLSASQPSPTHLGAHMGLVLGCAIFRDAVFC